MRDSKVIIIGGGLAGLTAAIHLAKQDIAVSLFEKETYPQHKVCGEYVSKEILPYFNELGIRLSELDPAQISVFRHSGIKGKQLEFPLPLGGIGISRYAFDGFLFQKARELKVEVIHEVVKEVQLRDNNFQVNTLNGKEYSAKVVLGAFGKRSLLDKNLGRSFFRKKAAWMAVKMHYENDTFPENVVALHNFKGGYCGLSRTETGAVNMCYLASYKSFKQHKNTDAFREKVLRKNPNLDVFFSEANPVFDSPLSIAQISFEQKTLIENHMLLLGDAAGLIHPLCGNGMAMAIHSAKIASELVISHLNKELSRLEIERKYRLIWKSKFRQRMRMGQYLQRLMLNEGLSQVSQNLLSKFPFLLPPIIERTHGQPIQ